MCWFIRISRCPTSPVGRGAWHLHSWWWRNVEFCEGKLTLYLCPRLVNNANHCSCKKTIVITIIHIFMYCNPSVLWSSKVVSNSQTLFSIQLNCRCGLFVCAVRLLCYRHPWSMRRFRITVRCSLVSLSVSYTCMPVQCTCACT